MFSADSALRVAENLSTEAEKKEVLKEQRMGENHE
jgi:hypothetical protein